MGSDNILSLRNQLTQTLFVTLVSLRDCPVIRLTVSVISSTVIIARPRDMKDCGIHRGVRIMVMEVVLCVRLSMVTFNVIQVSQPQKIVAIPDVAIISTRRILGESLSRTTVTSIWEPVLSV